MSIEIKRSPVLSGIAGIFLMAGCTFALTMFARADEVQPAQCARVAGAATNLELVRSADNDKTRAVAAGFLIRDWQNSLPTVMRELSKTSGPANIWQPDQVSYFLSITDILRTILSTNVDAIKLFRNCDNASIVRPLVWAARADSQNMRLNATLILGNTVDNTTVCLVLHHLRDPSINSNGRANLLGVTFAVAGYAYLENVREIQKSLDLLKPRVEASSGQTLKLMSDILARANASQNQSTPLSQAGLAVPCATYPYDSPLE